MQIPTTRIGDLEITRFMIGGNPFSGFSHQSRERTQAMLAWYTDERIIETLFQAQELGLTACLMRGDPHVTNVLKQYWDQGGTMRWIAQTDSRSITAVDGGRYCLDHGASACYLHGGVMDHYVAQERFDEIAAFIQFVQDAGLPAGLAGHVPADFGWAEANVDADFYMVCYYNPSDRALRPEHDPEATERYEPEDRAARVACIQTLQRPAIHYKILAAGRHDPKQAFDYATAHMRPQDAVVVGVYTEDNPNMIAEDLDLFMDGLRQTGQA